MKPRIYWAPPYVAALIMGALSFPGLASALTLEQALSVAEQDAPSLHAQAANLVAARSAAIPAGELPDPKLKLGLQSVPIEGDARWQLEQEAMTMQMVGGAGRPAVRSTGVHQNLCNGSRRGPVCHAGSGAHGVLDQGQNP